MDPRQQVRCPWMARHDELVPCRMPASRGRAAHSPLPAIRVDDGKPGGGLLDLRLDTVRDASGIWDIRRMEPRHARVITLLNYSTRRFSAFNGFLKVAFRIARHLRRRPPVGARVGLGVQASVVAPATPGPANTHQRWRISCGVTSTARLAGSPRPHGLQRVKADPTFRLIGSTYSPGCGATTTLHGSSPSADWKIVAGLRAVTGRSCTGRDADARRPNRARHGLARAQCMGRAGKLVTIAAHRASLAAHPATWTGPSSCLNGSRRQARGEFRRRVREARDLRRARAARRGLRHYM